MRNRVKVCVVSQSVRVFEFQKGSRKRLKSNFVRSPEMLRRKCQPQLTFTVSHTKKRKPLGKRGIKTGSHAYCDYKNNNNKQNNLTFIHPHQFQASGHPS